MNVQLPPNFAKDKRKMRTLINLDYQSYDVIIQKGNDIQNLHVKENCLYFGVIHNDECIVTIKGQESSLKYQNDWFGRCDVIIRNGEPNIIGKAELAPWVET